MNTPLEQRLHYPLDQRLPAPAEAIELQPGLRWIRMGLPFALDHINLWLLRDRLDGREGWTVIDCGIADEPTRQAWEQVFAQALDGLPVLRVIVTHMHPDHIGLAHWLTERWQCRLWISATDYLAACLNSDALLGQGGDAAADFAALHGLGDPASIDKIRRRTDYYASMVPQVPRRFRRLIDGQLLDIGGHAWRCIAGYGHSPEHIALHDARRGVLISGDMVLPRISTNVGVHENEPEGDPLPLFLGSLDRMRGQLPEDTLVLPSHGRPFTGLHERIRQLHEHHAARLQEVLDACAGRPCSAADILPVMFHRPLDLHQTTFALAEALAHLHCLWHQGRLRRTLGDDGVLRFAAAG